MKYTLIFFIGILISACNQPAATNDFENLKKNLAQVQKELATLKANQDHQIVHVVYFKLKPDANSAALIKEIKKIAAIEGLEELEVGTFKDLKDKRALSEFGVVMQMGFDTEAAYQAYQKHPLHIELKNNVGQYLAGPPVTYDFTVH